jgi:SAM-dependent methyltransferase
MFQRLKQTIKRSPRLKQLMLWGTRVTSPFGQIMKLSAVFRYAGFICEWQQFRKAGGQAAVLDWYPCLYDRTATTTIDAHYFYQAVWAFTKIHKGNVQSHVDIGSQVNFVGLLTAITRVTFLDIRPLVLAIPGYRGISASIDALPFRDGTVHSLSTLHVIEHIGLGRYGDSIDPTGPLKAAREIVRVLAPGGRVFISVPIGTPRVQFNGQRVFSVTGLLNLFHELDLIQMAMVDAAGMFHDNVKPESAYISEVGHGSDFGLGLFCLQKRC